MTLVPPPKCAWVTRRALLVTYATLIAACGGTPFFTPRPDAAIPLGVHDSLRSLAGSWRADFEADSVQLLLQDSIKFRRTQSAWISGTLWLGDTIAGLGSAACAQNWSLTSLPSWVARCHASIRAVGWWTSSATVTRCDSGSRWGHSIAGSAVQRSITAIPWLAHGPKTPLWARRAPVGSGSYGCRRRGERAV